MNIRFKDSNGALWEVDWRDFELAQERDPDGRTVPSDNVNQLLLTAEDCVWLWSLGIGTNEIGERFDAHTQT